MMNSDVDTTIEVLNNLRQKLEPCLSDSLLNSSLFTDLADIHEVCRSYINAVNEILNLDINNKEGMQKILYEIDNQMFEHLPYHLDSLKVLLPKVIDLFED